MAPRRPRKPPPSPEDYDDRVTVPCAVCRRELLGTHEKPFLDVREYVAGRVHGRPHCDPCFQRHKDDPLPPTNVFHIRARDY